MDVSALFKNTFLFLPVLIISLPEKTLVQNKNLALFLYGVVCLLINKADFWFQMSTFCMVFIFKTMSKIL